MLETGLAVFLSWSKTLNACSACSAIALFSSVLIWLPAVFSFAAFLSEVKEPNTLLSVAIRFLNADCTSARVKTSVCCVVDDPNKSNCSTVSTVLAFNVSINSETTDSVTFFPFFSKFSINLTNSLCWNSLSPLPPIWTPLSSDISPLATRSNNSCGNWANASPWEATRSRIGMPAFFSDSLSAKFMSRKNLAASIAVPRPSAILIIAPLALASWADWAFNSRTVISLTFKSLAKLSLLCPLTT